MQGRKVIPNIERGIEVNSFESLKTVESSSRLITQNVLEFILLPSRSHGHQKILIFPRDTIPLHLRLVPFGITEPLPRQHQPA